MKVISVNIGEITEVPWRGQTVRTGIFKHPVDAIQLGVEDVEKDHVVDRRVHGGVDKACYLFSSDAYGPFREKYRKLDWDWGMFGENVTMDSLREDEICIGDRYQLGSAVVEVSQPRVPCFKFGIRFGSQIALKDFIAQERSGVYVRLITPGTVKAGDSMKLIQNGSDISVLEIFQLLFQKIVDPQRVQLALELPTLAEMMKKGLRKLVPPNI